MRIVLTNDYHYDLRHKSWHRVPSRGALGTHGIVTGHGHEPTHRGFTSRQVPLPAVRRARLRSSLHATTSTSAGRC
jgi:hypothetical protein